ncbi:tol-pal system protein YbgF [Myxococcota bacterium]|nr:tol-pal system protein YbgF [Myxococcota bacterium]
MSEECWVTQVCAGAAEEIARMGQGDARMRAAEGQGLRPARIGARSIGVLLAAIGLAASGCATQGDLLRLEEEVTALRRTGRSGADPFARIAQLSSDVDVLRQEVRDLQGELELARKEAADALAEVRKTRTAVAQSAHASATGGAAASDYSAGASDAGAGEAAVATDAGTATAAVEASPGDEVAAYQKALDAWRGDDVKGCIDQFTAFLQVFPSSSYADDAAYWLADCTYSSKEYKRAVVRFNAVVNVYPDSPKAPDALYRQGESLLQLGPKFHEAARTVFKRVQKEYPDSPRAAEAKRQLATLGRDSG